MIYFDFIVTLNDEKQYTYGCEVVEDIETLDELKQMAIDEFAEEDEEAADLIDVSDVSVQVDAQGELYSYLAGRFTENTADDIINILDQLTTDDYDEDQVIAYLECFDLKCLERVLSLVMQMRQNITLITTATIFPRTLKTSSTTKLHTRTLV